MSDQKPKSLLDASEYNSFEVKKLENSRFINPYRVHFNHNEKKRIWDGIMYHASVSCIIYHTDKKSIILVRQFRPLVHVQQVLEAQKIDLMKSNQSFESTKIDWSLVSPSEAFTFELCAGICDKNKSLEETIQEEIHEECGFSVNLKDIHKISAIRSGSLHTIFYTEVNESMKTGPGGGNPDEGECIELVELPINKIREFINDDSNPRAPGK